MRNFLYFLLVFSLSLWAGVSFAASPGDVFVRYDPSGVITRNNLSTNPASKAVSIKPFVATATQSHTFANWNYETFSRNHDTYIPNVAFYICSKNLTYGTFSWNNTGGWPGGYAWDEFLSAIKSYSNVYPGSVTEPCQEKVDPCDNTDTDNDGVCNSCDKKPNEPDKDCVVITGTNSVTGQVEYMNVDEGCDGSTNSTYSSALEGSKLIYDIPPDGSNLYKIPSPTCGGADANGQCACKYPSGTTGAPNANMAKTEYVPIAGDPTQPDPVKPNIPDPEINPSTPPPVTPSDPTVADDPSQDTGSSNEEKQTETQQDIENAIRRLTKMVEDQGRALQEKQLTQIERQNAIIALAQTISQLNRYQNQLTETTNDRIKTTNYKLDVVKEAINAASGQISQNVKDLGSKVTGVGASVDAHGNAIQGKLDGVTGAINGQGTAIQGKLDGVTNALQGQTGAIQEGNAKLGAISDSLDEIKGKIPDSIVAQGTADLPTENAYDPNFENNDDFKEEPLADSIIDFIQNGMPLSSYFKGTRVVISGASPNLNVDVFGRSIVVNFSEYEDIFRQAGLVLVMIATIIAFMIIVNRR